VCRVRAVGVLCTCCGCVVHMLCVLCTCRGWVVYVLWVCTCLCVVRAVYVCCVRGQAGMCPMRCSPRGHKGVSIGPYRDDGVAVECAAFSEVCFSPGAPHCHSKGLVCATLSGQEGCILPGNCFGQCGAPGEKHQLCEA
jgi:hypothetical protein